MNPFTLRDYAGPDYFCNRKNETARIVNAIENQRNLTLSSVRKMGKTGLIHHVFNQLNRTREFDAIYFDIYYTTTLEGFINKFGTSLLAEEESFSEKVKRMINRFIKSIRPTVTFDSLSGAPTFSFNVQNETSSINTMGEIFGFLKERSLEKPMVVAIDEFQQIANYPKNNVEALLRTNIQKLQNVSFIFSGSDKRLLTSIFNDAKRPFYQSTELMHLEEIRSGNKSISTETVKQVYFDILKENEIYYSEYRDLLTKQQWNLLIALANEDGISKVTASAFIKKHNLSNTATVRRGIKSLIDKKLIYKKEMKYFVYDVFFAKWLARL